MKHFMIRQQYYHVMFVFIQFIVGKNEIKTINKNMYVHVGPFKKQNKQDQSYQTYLYNIPSTSFK